jgi:Natural resistance-associated macrophage protein
MVARLGIATGKGHAAMIYERFGKWWGRFSLIDLLVVNFLTLITEFAAISLALSALGISPYLSVPIAALGLTLMVVTGTSAVSHSPAHTDGNEPRTVTGSRCPRALTRSTGNPLSSLKKVTLSTSPAISSDGARGWRDEALILTKVYAGGFVSESFRHPPLERM